MVGRDELLVLLARALREHAPDVAEQRLRELERAMATTPALTAVGGVRADDVSLAMNRIERETPGGPRGIWTVSGGDGRRAVSVRAEPSRESAARRLDDILAPLLKESLPPEASALLPALQPVLGLLRAALPEQSPADVIGTVLERLQAPHRLPALADAESALRACFPGRADELLAALRRHLPAYAKELAREEQGDPGALSLEGLALAEAAASLATRVEDRQQGGARYRWTARMRGVSLELVREAL